jgi:alkylhydroperoxidase family enzyme
MREDMLSIWKEEVMARIAGITRSRSLLVRLVFFFSRRCYGRVIRPAQVYALHPDLLLAVGHMEAVQEPARQLGASVKHLASMLVAWRIGCPWCLDFGTRASEHLGITDDQLRALPDYEHSPLFSEEERTVLRYAEAMTRTPVRVPDALFAALKARYTDRQILELTAAIAWENFHARVNHALDLEAEGMASQVCLVPVQEEPASDTSPPQRELEREVNL